MSKNNPFAAYMGGLGGLGRWTPQQATPFDPEMLGFELGAGVQVPLQTYMRPAITNIWKIMPQDEIQAFVENVISKIATVGKVADVIGMAAEILSGVAAAAGMVVPVIEAIFSAPGWVTASIVKQQKENDSRRRNARLACAEYLLDFHPRYWVAPGNMAWGYNRTRKHDTTIVDAMIWPPAGSIPFGSTSPADWWGSDCNGARVSSADWCGLDRCSWTWGFFPFFFPYFHPDVFGRVWAPGEGNGAPVYLRGMQGSDDGGAAVLSVLMGYQTALLTNPALNLQADGSQIQEILRFFHHHFWNSYHTVSPRVDLSGAQIGMYNEEQDIWARIDKEFNPDNRGEVTGDYLYLAPNGLIGAYTSSGEGSLNAGVLNDWKVWMHDPNTVGVSSTGGAFITARDYNTITSIVQTFFAMRRATLQDSVLARALVNEQPGMFERRSYGDPYDNGGGLKPEYVIPEESVREAIKARARGETAGVTARIAKFKPKIARGSLARLNDRGDAVMDAARKGLTSVPRRIAVVADLSKTTPRQAELVLTKKPARKKLGG